MSHSHEESHHRALAPVGVPAEAIMSRRIRRAPPVSTRSMAGLWLALMVTLSNESLALASMSLPDGIENILGFSPRSSFQCERDGYFGDIENDCRIFHLCQKQVNPNGLTEWRHWTYACGNQTMFNQLTLTCAFVDEAIPCKHASQFQYLNEVIHRPREPFLTDADVTSGFSYYTNRILSDGARARAFEDSSLLAQLGGSVDNQILPAPSTTSLDQTHAFSGSSEMNGGASNAQPVAHTNSIEMNELPLSNAFQAALNTRLRAPEPIENVASPLRQFAFAPARASPQTQPSVRAQSQPQAQPEAEPDTEARTFVQTEPTTAHANLATAETTPFAPTETHHDIFNFAITTEHRVGGEGVSFVTQLPPTLPATTSTNGASFVPTTTTATIAESNDARLGFGETFATQSSNTQGYVPPAITTTTVASTTTQAVTTLQDTQTTGRTFSEAPATTARPTRSSSLRRNPGRRRQFASNHPGSFESIRLSSQRSQDATTLNKRADDGPIIMRQQPQTSEQTEIIERMRIRSGSANSVTDSHHRSKMEAHFVPNKFEALITRRRV